MQNFHDGWPVKVRKRWVCEWCGERIPAGTTAYRGKGKFDGSYYDYRMHGECAVAMTDTPYISSDGFMPHDNERPAQEVDDVRD